MKKQIVSYLKQFGLLTLLLASLVSCAASGRWYRGNTHTHTLWSDGNAPPEVSIAWYQDNGYDFLALSDHNIFLQEEKWVPVRQLRRGTIEQLRKRFGHDWPVLGANRTVMRLKTLPELRSRFNILLIQAEEITDRYQKWPVHVNGINLEELVRPRGGNSVYEVMQNNVDAVREQSKKTGTPMLAHLNHPNFRWGVTVEDLIKLKGDRFFEVYNGTPGVLNWGDAAHPGTERMWDIINSIRLKTGRPMLFGLATDDAHQYYTYGVGNSNAGRGWVMVHATALTPDKIIIA
ncbi:MAG: histidinol-phosphatase, partial [Planctomycetes bacterium]|nr:histidinol-phosphatase [Planctomycetota bacterium]